MVDYRDPLYGFIYLDKLEQGLVDLRAFQRLRHISQLGPTNLVYPTANHTRFEHSLGTLEASTELLNHLIEKPESRKVLEWDRDDIGEAKQLLRLAALLHDIGHAPFSHATEELFPDGQLHEDYTYRLITETDIGELIDKHLGEGIKIRVAEIAVKRAKSAKDGFLSELLTGDLGSDRIDYLLRDSHHLGVAYGQFDRHRLFNTLFIRNNPEIDGPELVLKDGGVHSVEGFLIARYFMFLDVYFHKTRRILDIHLTEFLKGWLPEGKLPTDLMQFIDLNDISIIHEMQTSNNVISERIWNRKFFRMCFETVDHPLPQELIAFNWLENDLTAQFGADNLRIDRAEKAPYQYSQPPIFVETLEGYRSLIERSPLTEGLRTIRKQRIYANPEIREKVESFCKEKWREKLQNLPQ